MPPRTAPGICCPARARRCTRTAATLPARLRIHTCAHTLYCCARYTRPFPSHPAHRLLATTRFPRCLYITAFTHTLAPCVSHCLAHTPYRPPRNHTRFRCQLLTTMLPIPLRHGSDNRCLPSGPPHVMCCILFPPCSSLHMYARSSMPATTAQRQPAPTRPGRPDDNFRVYLTATLRCVDVGRSNSSVHRYRISGPVLPGEGMARDALTRATQATHCRLTLACDDDWRSALRRAGGGLRDDVAVDVVPTGYG